MLIARANFVSIWSVILLIYLKSNIRHLSLIPIARDMLSIKLWLSTSLVAHHF